VKLLEGKTLLVTGVTNRWSIATGIAAALHAHGATIVLTYQGERVKGEVTKFAAELGGAVVFECDVTSDQTLRELSASVGKLDGFVHSIAFVNKEDLAGKVYDTSRSGFALALDISSYSLIALAAALRENLNDGASIMALTYYGATASVPN
jgi:enoyl-[acyl-carrier protein] reductase I